MRCRANKIRCSTFAESLYALSCAQTRFVTLPFSFPSFFCTAIELDFNIYLQTNKPVAELLLPLSQMVTLVNFQASPNCVAAEAKIVPVNSTLN